jgi:hypothetical protein
MIAGGGFAAWATVLGVLLILVAVGAPASFKTFLAWALALALLGLAGLFAYWTNAVRTMAYVIERNALTVSWGAHHHVIPIAGIQRLVPGRTLDLARVKGLNWWGCHVGEAEVNRIGHTYVYSTHSTPDEILYIVTDAGAFAFTVVDQAAFAEEVQARAALGPVRAAPTRGPGTAGMTATGIAALSFWGDRVALGAAAALVLVTALVAGYLSWKYPGLPDVIQLNFPALGGLVRVGNKTELIRIVYLAVGIMAANLALGVIAHPWERAASIWFLASGTLVQGVLLAAAIVAVQRS